MRVGDILLIIVLAFGAGLFGGNLFFHDMWFALATGCRDWHLCRCSTSKFRRSGA